MGQSYDSNQADKTQKKMSKLTLLAFLLAFVALSYANPIDDDPFQLEEEEDYPDYGQSISDHLEGRDPCEGRIALLANGKRKSASNTFKLKANRRRSTVQVQGVK